MALNVKRQEYRQKKEAIAMKNTLQGNYWAGGQGYGAAVSSLLYEDGAKGGAQRKYHNVVSYQYGHGRRNPNRAHQKRK